MANKPFGFNPIAIGAVGALGSMGLGLGISSAQKVMNTINDPAISGSRISSGISNTGLGINAQPSPMHGLHFTFRK